MTKKCEQYLEKQEAFANGTLFTYLEFRGDTTGMITKVFRSKDKSISEARNFRVAFEGKYDRAFPMLGRAEHECFSSICNKIHKMIVNYDI